MSNRLNLDFQLSTSQERSSFLESYLQRPEFTSKPPTESELETMGNYVLWGIDPQTGLSAQKDPNSGIRLQSKNKTWDPTPIQSIESLLASPTFWEGSLHPLGSVAPAKIKREVFGREKELARAGRWGEELKTLWKEIDELEWEIGEWELRHGRRTKPLRVELEAQLEEWGSDLERLRDVIDKWNSYGYLKQRHRLVELRREQYTIRDFYAPTSALGASSGSALISELESIGWGVDVEVFPIGIRDDKAQGLGENLYIFRRFGELNPEGMGEDVLGAVSKIYNHYCNRRNEVKKNRENGKKYVDFENIFHIQQIVGLARELEVEREREGIESTLGGLLDTFWYYVEEAQLGDVHRDILKMKIGGRKNSEIAEVVNGKYGKTYSANYISTIYCQKIMGRIAAAATRHMELVGNLWFGEEWKKCSGCGKTMLRDTENFTRRERAKDGLSARCKKCEKMRRDKADKIEN